MVKIISYNINGIRAAVRKGFINWLFKESPDVLCLQEIKATKDQINIIELESLGYHVYWFPAEKKGYSGVAILSKKEPNNVEIGVNNNLYDSEGRVIRADFDNFSALSVYMPSGSSGDLRQRFKMKWLDFFIAYSTELKSKIPHLVISGDYNICHEAIDIHDPVRNKNSSGFLPEEREWMSQFINKGFVDSFRQLNKEPHHYSWWSYRANARNNNKGWRIDYNMVSESLSSKISHAAILKEAELSDHCPVSVELDL